MPDASPNLYEFQPYVFRKDTGTLERNGYTIRLNDQAAKVLGEFVGRPGELIGRQQLSQLLWPDGVFTESELGINKIISKLRISLRDDPKNPRYIQTIPKRGYRFLAPVTITPVNVPEAAEAAGGAGPAAAVLEAHDAGIATVPELRKAARFGIAWNRGLLVALVVGAVALAAFGLAWRLQARRHVLAKNTSFSLAVAPFEVRDGDQAGSQLAESFRLDLVDSLSQMPGLTVQAAHSVNTRSSDAQGRAAPQKLDVMAILYTEFTRTGDLYTLRMELVRNSDSAHLEGWHYSGTVAQLGNIREQAQSDIFGYCAGSAAGRGSTSGSTQNPAAYELYLRARYHVRQVDHLSLEKAHSEYEEAIRLDPNFAKAFSGLATVEFNQAVSDADYKRAERLAQQAIALAPNVAEAHAVLGYAYFRHEWRFAEGEQEERKAIALEPHESRYHVWLSLMLAKLGQFDESEKEIELAKKDDPYWVEVYVGETFLTLSEHKPDRMMQSVNTIIELKPDWPDSYHERAWANWSLGRYAQAIADWRRVAQMQGAADRIAFEDRGLAAYQAGGERAYAKLRMEAALHFASQGRTDGDFVPAEWAAYAGYYQTSLRELVRGVELRDRESTNLAINPAYNPMRRDPRFQSLLRRIGLPDATASAL